LGYYTYEVPEVVVRLCGIYYVIRNSF